MMPSSDLFFARSVLSSKGEGCPPIHTLHLRYPRFIHPEIMTHRVFSRNARSSRAVPVAKMIQEIQDNPVVPWHWTANQPGMQGLAGHNQCIYLEEPTHTDDGYDWRWNMYDEPEKAWLKARDAAVKFAEAFAEAGYHKQIVNRLLEPFMWIDTLVTSTDWNNFFELRDHPDAEPHLRDLAQLIRTAISTATVHHLSRNDWHLPYVTDKEINTLLLSDLLGLSAARCARISYAPFDGQDSLEKERARIQKLKSKPLHASPFEHQASPDPNHKHAGAHRNFTRYIQYRSLIDNTSF